MCGLERGQMKAVEFESTVAPGGQISVPLEIAQLIPAGEQLRVVVMWENSDSDVAQVSRQPFEGAYAPEDEVYERLMDDPSIR
jgi:hypothetical protein